MRETLNVILNECEGSVTVMREDGKKIKATSCELSAVSCKLTIPLRFKSLRQASTSIALCAPASPFKPYNYFSYFICLMSAIIEKI